MNLSLRKLCHLLFLPTLLACSPSPSEPTVSASPRPAAAAQASPTAAPTMVSAQEQTPATAPMERQKKRLSLKERNLLSRVSQTLKGESATDYFERGTLYLTVAEQEQIFDAYASAVEDFSQAIKADPKLMAAYNNRAMAYVRMGEEEKALSDFEAASKLDPKDANILGRQASVLSKLGRDQEAIALYDKAYALGGIDFVFNRANAHARLGNHKDAEQDYRLVIEKSQNPQIVEAAKMNLEALSSP